MKNSIQLLLFCLLAGLFSTQFLFGQNVGIGTTTPSQKLDVAGNIVASGGGNITATGVLSATQLDFSGIETGNINTSGNINAGGTLTAGTIDFSGTETGNINTTGVISTTNTILGNDIFATGNLSANMISFSGNEAGNLSTTGDITTTGIFTANDAFLGSTVINGNLDVSGGLDVGLFNFTNSTEVGNIATSGTISAATIDFSGTETGNISTTGNVYGNDVAANGTLSGSTINFAGTEVGNIATTGNISATGTITSDVFFANTLNAVDIFASNSCSCPSDARFKQGIQQFPQALEKVLALRGVEYDFNCAAFPERGFSQRHQIGFIAQELQAVLPELVTTMEDGYLAVDYQKLTPVLVEAIKSQQQTILELQSKLQQVESLNSSVSKLEARLLELEKAGASAVVLEK